MDEVGIVDEVTSFKVERRRRRRRGFEMTQLVYVHVAPRGVGRAEAPHFGRRRAELSSSRGSSACDPAMCRCRRLELEGGMEKVKMISPFRLSSLLRLEKDPKLALQLFQNPNPHRSQKSFRYSLLSYDLIISKLGRAKMFEEMEEILDQMKEENRFSPKEVIFCNVIAFYGRSRLSEQALRTYDRIPSFRCQRTVKSLNSLLNAFLNCRELDKIREIYLDIDRYSSPDACTYNILMNAACRNDLLDVAWDLFDEMGKKGIQPNAITFGTLISALCDCSKLDDAFRLKEDMLRVFHVKPNAFVYVSLIKGLCKANELNLAFKLKEEMLADKTLGLDSAVYTTLIGALFQAGRKGEVSGILEEMREAGCKPDTVTYNAMISGFCMEKDFDSAFGVLDEMMEKGCKPDVVSYNIIIAGLYKEGRSREACDLFEDMPRRGSAPDIVSYRTVFDGLCEGMEFKEATSILDEMVFKGFVPHVSSIQKFVDRLCREGDVDLLMSVLNSLAKGNAINVDIWKMVTTIVCRKSELFNTFDLPLIY